MKVQIKIFADPDCSYCNGAGITQRKEDHGGGMLLAYPPIMCSCVTSESVGDVILEEGDEDRIMHKVLD